MNVERKNAKPEDEEARKKRNIEEMERKKKSKKYKEDKLRARKDHTKSILEQQAYDNRARGMYRKKSEFLCTLKFRNSLPDIPFDPKFLSYPQEKNIFSKYKPNALESEYVYKLHLEPNLGLNIDVVDPSNYETPSTKVSIPKEDKLIFDMPDEINVETEMKSKAAPDVSWLRRSQYMGNDLYDSVHQFKTDSDLQKDMRSRNEMLLLEDEADLEVKTEKSFLEIPSNDAMIHPTNESLKAKHVWSVYPDTELYGNKYSILAFDMLPSVDMKGSNKEARQNKAILRNVQEIKQKSNISTLIGSLLLPTGTTKEKEKGEEADEQEYAYFRDYQINLNRKAEDDDDGYYLFMLDPNSDDVTYCEMSTRFVLKKTKIGKSNSRVNDAIVYRRDYTEEEIQDKAKRQNKLVEGDTIIDGDAKSDVEDDTKKNPQLNQQLNSPQISDADSDSSDSDD